MSAEGPFHIGFPQPAIVVTVATSFDGTTTWRLEPASLSDEPAFVLTCVQTGGYRDPTEREWRLPASALSTLARLVEQTRLPLLPAGIMGLDGTTYSVEIRVGMGGGTWSWWSQPPAGWEPLGEIVSEVRALAVRHS